MGFNVPSNVDVENILYLGTQDYPDDLSITLTEDGRCLDLLDMIQRLEPTDRDSYRYRDPTDRLHYRDVYPQGQDELYQKRVEGEIRAQFESEIRAKFENEKTCVWLEQLPNIDLLKNVDVISKYHFRSSLHDDDDVLPKGMVNFVELELQFLLNFLPKKYRNELDGVNLSVEGIDDYRHRAQISDSHLKLTPELVRANFLRTIDPSTVPENMPNQMVEPYGSIFDDLVDFRRSIAFIIAHELAHQYVHPGTNEDRMDCFAAAHVLEAYGPPFVDLVADFLTNYILIDVPQNADVTKKELREANLRRRVEMLGVYEDHEFSDFNQFVAEVCGACWVEDFWGVENAR